MVSVQALLQILADGKYHSGVALGKQLGVSRAAIWKLVQKVEANYALSIFAVRGKGYRLAQPLQLLDKQLIQSQLSAKTIKKYSCLEILFDIDSTNYYLTVKSLEGAATGYVVLAEQQSKGQGRRGRKWVSPFGSNLYLSLLWRFQLSPAQLGCLSLFVGVAVVRVLRNLGAKEVGIKWPNDIYYQDKKVGGILLEMRAEANGPSNVVIGLGLNVNMSLKATPNDKDSGNTVYEELAEIAQPWTDLNSIMKTNVDRNELAALVINALFDVLSAVPTQQSELLSEWQEMDILKGEMVDVHFADKVITAKANGINESGALKVLHDGKEVICHSADVSIRRQHE